MLTEDIHRIREKSNQIISKLDLLISDLEITESDSVYVAGITYQKGDDGKLKCQLILGPHFSYDDEEKTLGHEFGHVKFSVEHQKVHKLLEILQMPITFTRTLIRSYIAESFYALATGVLVSVGYPYLALATASPVVARYLEDYLATRETRKSGVKTSFFAYLKK